MTFRKFAGLVALVMCIALFGAGESYGALTISADFDPVFTIGTVWEGKFTAVGEEIESCKWTIKLLSGSNLKMRITDNSNPMTLTAEAYTGTAIGTASFTVTCTAAKTAGRPYKLSVTEDYGLTVYALNFQQEISGQIKFGTLFQFHGLHRLGLFPHSSGLRTARTFHALTCGRYTSSGNEHDIFGRYSDTLRDSDTGREIFLHNRRGIQQ